MLSLCRHHTKDLHWLKSASISYFAIDLKTKLLPETKTQLGLCCQGDFKLYIRHSTSHNTAITVV